MNFLTNQEERILKGMQDLYILNDKMPGIKKLMEYLTLNSTRGTVKIINELVRKEYLNKSTTGRLSLNKLNLEFKESDDHTDTIQVPVLGEVSCGLPILAQENIETFISVSTSIAKSGYKYFFLRANGDSMNKEENIKAIKNGDFVLVKVQNYASEGERIVALIDDAATIKAYYPKSNHVLLKPRTDKPKKYHPILVREEFRIQGIVIDVLENIDDLLE